MKHISEFLSIRRQQFERQRQLSLFAAQSEKGSNEWNTFNGVRGDRIDNYPVRMPRKAIVITEPRRVLRIVYPRVRTAYGG